MKRKIVIDTDIGDDIDDAFAIALAAAIPQAEIVGITTVFRNTAARAQLAEKLLETAGTDVPVFAGERIPVKEPFHAFDKDGETAPEQSVPCQWDESYAKYPVNGGATDFLIAAAERYGEDLTIVAIGPLTNLAKAIERAPECMKKTGKIVSMGGSFKERIAEWNILCDPEAAETVYGSGIPLYAVGLDVTLQCPMENGLLDKFSRSERAVNGLLSLWLRRWFDFFGFEKSVMHDPLAVASCFTQACRFQKQYVKIDLEEIRGSLLVSAQPREGYAPVFVADEVDRALFYRTVEKYLLGESGFMGESPKIK